MFTGILTVILKLLGLAAVAEKLIAKHEADKKAQEIADAPQTKQEEIDYFKDK